MGLVLGTAEFNPEGYAGKPSPPEEEIARIFKLAWEGGVRMLDTADAYHCDDLIRRYASDFGALSKTRELPLPKCRFYHYQPGELRYPDVTRASVYDLQQIPASRDRDIIVPFSIRNTTFIECLPQAYIRSVFDRGNLLKDHTIRECLSFAKRHTLKGVIVGVNSVKELEEILKVW